MKTSRWTMTAAMILAAAAALGASSGGPQETAPAASVTDLAWMAGTWTGTDRGVDALEHWTAPGGGMLLGVHRDVREGRTMLFEFLRIVERDGSLVYLAQPMGREATPFVLAEIGPQRAVFANPEHDFPQRIIYWRDADAFHARVEGTMNGQFAAQEWRWIKS